MTARIVCFDKAEQRQYQNRLDMVQQRAAHQDAVEGRITAELMVKALAGMNDPQAGVCLPYVSWPAESARSTVKHQPVAEAVFDLLANDSSMSALMQVLQHSQCPRVAVFKVGLARAYAEMHAADLAQRECDE